MSGESEPRAGAVKAGATAWDPLSGGAGGQRRTPACGVRVTSMPGAAVFCEDLQP